MNVSHAVSRALQHYGSAVLATRDRDGYPVSVRCMPVADEYEAAFAVPLPGGLGITAGPAWLLCHSHDLKFWSLQSFGARGRLERCNDGWLFRPTAVVPGMGGALAMLRLFIGGRRRAHRYLAAHRIEPPEIPWAEVNVVKARVAARHRAQRDGNSSRIRREIGKRT